MSLADRRLCHTLTAEHGTDGRFGWQSAYGIGTYLMKINIINKVMKFIGGISYEAFLTHHVTICLFIKFVPADATVMMRVILLIAILAATGISAVVLKQVCKTIMSLGRARKKNIA